MPSRGSGIGWMGGRGSTPLASAGCVAASEEVVVGDVVDGDVAGAVDGMGVALAIATPGSAASAAGRVSAATMSAEGAVAAGGAGSAVAVATSDGVVAGE